MQNRATGRFGCRDGARFVSALRSDAVKVFSLWSLVFSGVLGEAAHFLNEVFELRN